jgi:P450-derived glycosyltransferase activator
MLVAFAMAPVSPVATNADAAGYRCAMGAVSFAVDLYRQRLMIARNGYLHRDPMALLQLRPGRDDPYRIYARMRAAGPIQPTRLGNWTLTGHQLCNQALRDRRLGVRSDDRPPPEGDPDLSFLTMNPPDHTRLRRLVQPAFSPRRMAHYLPRIESTTAALLDRAGDRFDLVSALAAPLPIAVITDLLGVPDAGAAEFARYGTVIGSALDGIRSLSHVRALLTGSRALDVLFEKLFELRRHEPADDIVSQLVAAEGDQIEPRELRPMCGLLLIAGFETTVNLIGNAVTALLDHPEHWAALCDDPAGMAPRVVDETLRYDPPVQRTGRIALEHFELGGRQVHKGQFVAVIIGAANRDPQVYPDPDRFDPHRAPGPDHLAFSSGIHYCVGQPLARIEAEVALRLLAERMPRLRRAGRVRRRASNTIRGPIRLPVAVAGPR